MERNKNENVITCPPCGERACPRGLLSGGAVATKRGAYKVTSLMSPSIGPADHFLRKGGRKGFTLIELLVVVLIIGILAAIAVPQYKVAVTKSRITQMLPLINAIDKAEQVYFLANGQYTQNAQEASKLDLDLPPGGQIIGNEVVYSRKFSCRLPTSTKSIKCTLDNLSIERWLIPLTAYDNAKTICWAENNTAWHAKVCKTFGGIQREHSSTTLTLYTLD